MELKDKVVIITGGSQGFGKALAKELLQEDAKVVISSNANDRLEATAKELGADHFLADVTSIESLRALGSYVTDKYGRIDIWINNAGIQLAPSLLEEINPEKARRLFDINFFGYFYGCQIALSHMKQQGEGLILNVNSTAGLEGKPQISAYVSSKFAVKGLTESIRKELGDSAVKVYAVFPGGMQTEIYKEKEPTDLLEYMEVGPVAKKVIENLKSGNPEIDLIVKRPTK